MSTWAILAALMAALSWAVASVAISRLLARGRVSPAAANLFKNGLAAACFFLAALVYGGGWPVGAAWGWLFLSGFLGFTVSDTLYFSAFQRCGVQTAATVLLLNVPLAALLAVPLAGDTLDRKTVPYMAVVFVGVMLVILGSHRPRTVAPRAERADGDGDAPGAMPPAGSASSAAATPGRYAVGVLMALAAAVAIGTAVPLGRGRFDDVGVAPGGFIRLLGGATGVLPLVLLAGLRPGRSPGGELSRLVQPALVAPGSASIWGGLSLFGASAAVVGLIPYHYALRELPGGMSALLFASTPLFTLPLAWLLGQRVGWVAVLGTALGFAGVGGILLRGDALPKSRTPAPVLEALELSAPEGARLPSFVVVEGRDLEFARPDEGVGRPVLSVAPDPEFPEAHRLMLIGRIGGAAALERAVLSESQLGAGRSAFFVNWADIPKAAKLGTGGGLVIAHPERLGEGPYAYGVRLTLEEDGPPGRDLGWLHDDVAAVEHGFVSILPESDGGASFVWLDGRHAGPGHGTSHGIGQAGGGMGLFARTLRADGALMPETELDDLVCECCPTDSAVLEDGSLLVVYRDRTKDELRDIRCVRRAPDGSEWGASTLVHADGWKIAGCPVNGPSIAVQGETVAVAWFTQGTKRGLGEVRVAYSFDRGATFGEPTTLVRGETLGRVSIAPFRPTEGAPVRRGGPWFGVAHLATVPGAVGSGAAAWRAAAVGPRSEPSEWVTLAEVEATRRSGRLDLAPLGEYAVDAVWLGSTGLLAARLRLPLAAELSD